MRRTAAGPALMVKRSTVMCEPLNCAIGRNSDAPVAEASCTISMSPYTEVPTSQRDSTL